MKYGFDLDQLEMFRLVIERGSLSRVAEDCGITQPGVSKSIRRLEQGLGFKLFERIRGKTTPTHEAMLFYETVKATLAGATRLAERAREIAENKVGSLQIISHPFGAVTVLPAIIQEFRLTHPDVHIRVQTANSPQLSELARTNAFDIGLAEPPLDKRSLRTSLHSLKCVCVMLADHPLASSSFVTLKDFAGFPFVVSARDQPFHLSLRQLFDKEGITWNPAVEVDMGAMEVELILRGIGIGVLDELTAAKHQSRGLVARPLRPAPRYEFLVFQPNRQASLIASDFTKLLKARFRAVHHKDEDASNS
ncbi:LysR family transcriptional regulator [Rhizobium sp. BR 314]|uniref:LysR family transcriptional regulator n=1 Tax=Rhizobium sp. BR 314 TaxID=3040013 RepID=UPI0039BEE5A6